MALRFMTGILTRQGPELGPFCGSWWGYRAVGSGGIPPSPSATIPGGLTKYTHWQGRHIKRGYRISCGQVGGGMDAGQECD